MPCPDPAAGLYIRDRRGRLIKVNIPADHVAFQMGESMQVHSGEWGRRGSWGNETPDMRMLRWPMPAVARV